MINVSTFAGCFALRPRSAADNADKEAECHALCLFFWNTSSPDRLAQSVSDKDGRFALETLDAGEFIVSVVAANYRAAARVVSFDFDDGNGASIQFRLERSPYCERDPRAGRLGELQR